MLYDEDCQFCKIKTKLSYFPLKTHKNRSLVLGNKRWPFVQHRVVFAIHVADVFEERCQ